MSSLIQQVWQNPKHADKSFSKQVCCWETTHTKVSWICKARWNQSEHFMVAYFEEKNQLVAAKASASTHSWDCTKYFACSLMISSFWSSVIAMLSSRITSFPSMHTFKEFTISPDKFRDPTLQSEHSLLNIQNWVSKTEEKPNAWEKLYTVHEF